jgi:tRNA U34 5-methylaminomethyl-2-thiouridine-forming methyltransferase MnmC
MSGIKLIITSDGSHSLLNEGLNETYHSVHGAIQESEHVFINNGLNYFLDSVTSTRVSILEVGFGTGLNALLSMRRLFDTAFHTKYVTVEAFPLEEELWRALNYTRTIGLEDFFLKIHQADWGQMNTVLPNFELLKRHLTLQDVELPFQSFDVVYFDAFAPNKQPEMWTIDALEKVVNAMNINGIFVTYCAKGQLKRDLKSLGLRVETLSGPPGKKEMTRATKRKLQ